MLSEAKHLCLCSRRNGNGNNQRFFASLRMTMLVTLQDVSPLICALRLNFDVDWNRLADTGHRLGPRTKHQVEIAPRDWLSCYGPACPARVVERCK